MTSACFTSLHSTPDRAISVLSLIREEGHDSSAPLLNRSLHTAVLHLRSLPLSSDLPRRPMPEGCRLASWLLRVEEGREGKGREDGEDLLCPRIGGGGSLSCALQKLRR